LIDELEEKGAAEEKKLAEIRQQEHDARRSEILSKLIPEEIAFLGL